LVFSCAYERIADEKTFQILAGEIPIPEALGRL
jgi:hypothetical protein